MTRKGAHEVFMSRSCPVCGTLKNDRQWLCLNHWRSLSSEMQRKLSGGLGWKALNEAVKILKGN